MIKCVSDCADSPPPPPSHVHLLPSQGEISLTCLNCFVFHIFKLTDQCISQGYVHAAIVLSVVETSHLHFLSFLTSSMSLTQQLQTTKCVLFDLPQETSRPMAPLFYKVCIVNAWHWMYMTIQSSNAIIHKVISYHYLHQIISTC